MNFLKFAKEYKKLFPNITSEEICKAFQVNNEHQDEDVNRFWNALKNKNVECGEFLQLSEGIHFLENEDKTSIIYICKCYHDLAKIAFDKKMKKDCELAVIWVSERRYLATTYFIYFQSYQKNSNAWYIVDAKIPVKANARTILLCSSRKDLYRDFDKFGLSTKEKVEELFLKWGGIPRFVLEQADDKDTDEMSYKLVHIYTNLPFADEVKDENEMDLDTISTIPNDVMLDRHDERPYIKSIIRFVSDFIKQEVTKTLEEDIRNKLHTETNLSLKAGISNSLLGMLFEQIAH
ncbi:12348_t:CDS:2 [Funneliformis mosseae]|uniref:12348_t:CDS:1 n=1 Tax=Funneliformis mosseae TaxID=27381 RepID=A0A9N8VGX3_FUNMO|nr:12348_t:CDS:2 [Funneliformis mosseae]